MYAGVDWAGNGWFAVFLTEDGSVEGHYYPTLWNLWRERNDDITRMLVDIPIGLCEDKKRACDVEAKRVLGGRHQSSVFYTPTRDAVCAENIEAAKERQREAEAGFGIQNQAWSLVPRIREVDAFVTDYDNCQKVFETHPEVCFDALNDGSLRHQKSDNRGIEERLNLLDERCNIDVRGFYETSRSTFREPTYAPIIGGKDDIIDALVAAVSAASTEGDLPSLPRRTEPDYDTTLNRKIEIKLPATE